uniref:Uncharacterized protein n=1 Tax=Oryza punctata TaxID=4537 RepID=A0A0E0JUG0_ORYPU
MLIRELMESIDKHWPGTVSNAVLKEASRAVVAVRSYIEDKIKIRSSRKCHVVATQRSAATSSCHRRSDALSPRDPAPRRMHLRPGPHASARGPARGRRVAAPLFLRETARSAWAPHGSAPLNPWTRSRTNQTKPRIPRFGAPPRDRARLRLGPACSDIALGLLGLGILANQSEPPSQQSLAHVHASTSQAHAQHSRKQIQKGPPSKHFHTPHDETESKLIRLLMTSSSTIQQHRIIQGTGMTACARPQKRAKAAHHSMKDYETVLQEASSNTKGLKRSSNYSSKHISTRFKQKMDHTTRVTCTTLQKTHSERPPIKHLHTPHDEIESKGINGEEQDNDFLGKPLTLFRVV